MLVPPMLLLLWPHKNRATRTEWPPAAPVAEGCRVKSPREPLDKLENIGAGP